MSVIEEDDFDDFDCMKNGGKMTNRDLWNIVDQESFKIVVINGRLAFDGEFDGRYVCAASPGIKYRCERSTCKKWYCNVDEDPCRYCEREDKDECDRSMLQEVEDGLLLIDTLSPRYEQEES